MVAVALVGLGDIGVSAHLPALLRHDEIEVAALVDADPVRLDHARELMNGDPLLTGDLDDVLGAGIGAVVLATPPWVTPTLTVDAVRHGAFVLAEKPVATSVATAGVYDPLSDDERRRIQVGLTYRHDPAIQQLGGWLREGRLGSPVLARAHVYDEPRDPADHEHSERIRRTLEHGSPVVHEGAHVFDWLSFLFGSQPVAVQDAWSVRTHPDLPAANLTGARLSYPHGNTALVEFGWFTDVLPRCELTFLGSRGLATLDGQTFRLSLTTGDRTDIVDQPGDRTDRCFDLQVARFADLVTGRSTMPTPSLTDGLAALATAEQAARPAGAPGS